MSKQIKFTNDTIQDAVDEWNSNKDNAIEKYGHISKWDVSNVTDMYKLFERATSFNEDITGWDVSNVTDMSYMFHEAILFNKPIGIWKTKNVKDMQGMFWKANLSSSII